MSGCAGAGAPAPDRTLVESHIAAPPAGATVAPAPPRHIELRSAAGETYMSSVLHPEELLRVGDRLDPVDELPVWWGESGLPGTSAEETVVVVGHNYTSRDAPFRALRLVRPGDRVGLSTANGDLEYEVTDVGMLAKGSLLGEHALREQVPGRLLLANCDVRDGKATEDNFFVVAQLL